MESILNNEIKRIIKRLQKTDPNKYKNTQFFTSILIDTNGQKYPNQNKEPHKIILTCIHDNQHHSRIIFPKTSEFEYMSLEEEMEYLYNSTM